MVFSRIGVYVEILHKKKQKNIDAETNSSATKKSMWRPLSSELQSVQALLTTQRMLRADFVGRLCGCDVNLGIFGGGFPCQDTKNRSSLLEIT